MWAVCENCGEDVHWLGVRGARLADVRCRCGGKCRSHRTLPARPSPTAGKTYSRCVVCGRKRIKLISPDFVWVPRFHKELGPFAAGTPTCRIHEPIPAENIKEEPR